jgi:hypothetical protein
MEVPMYQYSEVHPPIFPPPSENTNLLYPQPESHRRGGVFWVTCCGVCIFFSLILLVTLTVFLAFSISCSIGSWHQTDIYSFAPADLQSLEVNNELGHVQFIKAQKGQENITVSITRRAGMQKYLDGFDRDIETSKGKLTITEKLVTTSDWNWLGPCRTSYVTISLPEKLEDLSVRGVNGAGFMRIHNMKLDSVILINLAGSIDIESLETFFISARATKGEVHIKNLRATIVEAMSSEGGIYGEDGSLVIESPKKDSPNAQRKGYLSLSTSNSPINMPKIQIKTNTEVQVQGEDENMNMGFCGYSGSFLVQTNQGKIDLKGDVKYSRNDKLWKEGVVGKGNSTLLVHNKGGDVFIQFR